MWEKIRKYYPPGLDILTFSLTFGMFIYVFIFYSRLPAEIPIHFNAAGEADGWGGKGTLFGLMIIHFFVVALLFILNYNMMIRSNNTRESLRFVNIPFINKESLSTEQIYLVKRNATKMLAMTNLAISVMFVTMYYTIIQNGLGKQSGLGFWTDVTLVLIFVPVIYYIRRMYRDVKDGSVR